MPWSSCLPVVCFAFMHVLCTTWNAAAAADDDDDVCLQLLNVYLSHSLESSTPLILLQERSWLCRVLLVWSWWTADTTWRPLVAPMVTGILTFRTVEVATLLTSVLNLKVNLSYAGTCFNSRMTSFYLASIAAVTKNANKYTDYRKESN